MSRGHNALRAWVRCDVIGCFARHGVDRTNATSERDIDAAAAEARSLGWTIEGNGRRAHCPAHRDQSQPSTAA